MMWKKKKDFLPNKWAWISFRLKSKAVFQLFLHSWKMRFKGKKDFTALLIYLIWVFLYSTNENNSITHLQFGFLKKQTKLPYCFYSKKKVDQVIPGKRASGRCLTPDENVNVLPLFITVSQWPIISALVCHTFGCCCNSI